MPTTATNPVNCVHHSPLDFRRHLISHFLRLVQGNTPPGGVAGGPVTTKPSPASAASPELVMTSQEQVPVTEMENVDMATPTEAVRG